MKLWMIRLLKFKLHKLFNQNLKFFEFFQDESHSASMGSSQLICKDEVAIFILNTAVYQIWRISNKNCNPAGYHLNIHTDMKYFQRRDYCRNMTLISLDLIHFLSIFTKNEKTKNQSNYLHSIPNFNRLSPLKPIN